MIKLFTPPILENAEQTRKARVLFWLLWGLIAIITISELADCLVLTKNSVRWLTLAFAVDATSLIFLGLNRRGQTRLASHLLLWFLFALVIGLAWTGGGIRAPEVSIFPLAVLAAGLLLSWRAGIVTGLLCVLCELGLVLAERTGFLPASAVHHTTFSLWMSSVIFVALLLLLQYLAVESINEALKTAREELAHRQQTEATLRESDRRFRAIFNSTFQFIGLLRPDGSILEINDAALEFGGLKLEAIRGRFFWDTHWWSLSPEIQSQLKAVVAQAAGGQFVRYEVNVQGKDDRVLTIDFSLNPIKDETGQVVLLLPEGRAVTERKQAEAAVEESRQMLRSVLDTIPVRVFWKDLEGRYLGCNHPFARDAGFDSPEALVGRDDYAMGWKDQADLYRADDQKVISSGVPKLYYEEPQTTPAGKQMWLRTSKIPLRNLEGRIVGVLGTYEDISERKLAEERIREQSALLDAANDAIYVRALDHTVTYWNDGAERLYGWTRAEALDRKITDLGDVDHEAFAVAHATLLEQGDWSGELKKISKAGKKLDLFCRWTLLRDEQGRPREILAINTDITERKQLEANFLRAQRMEGIGALAGGIAHDLNNILQPILMIAPLLRETTADHETRELLDTVENNARRGADIIKQLLTFARGEPGARVPLPLRHLLNEMDKLIHETFPKNIQLRVNMPKNLWQVLGDATQIHQALMNLCVNARDAMPNGGTLTLAAENLNLDEAFAALMPGAKPGPCICVSVADTGMGIPQEHLDRIFDPFFTTKEIGKGTGLGLATVLGIARGHGGLVRVKSRVGQGTIFELYLPAALETEGAALTKRETLPPRAAGELILVVDDEASVRSIVQRTLEQHGYRVVIAAEGAEAMVLFTRRRSEIQAVLTDMMMPNMDGPSLVRALRQLELQLPILGMTGVGEKADIKGLEALDLAALLTKPFNGVGLLNALHQALAAPGKADGKPQSGS